MAAPMTQAAYIAAVGGQATARGITDAEELRRVRNDAADFWQSRLNTTSGTPSGSPASN